VMRAVLVMATPMSGCQSVRRVKRGLVRQGRDCGSSLAYQ